MPWRFRSRAWSPSGGRLLPLMLCLAFVHPAARAVALAQNTLTTVSAPWRVTLADRPAFSDPAFDDTGWALLQPNQILRPSLHLPAHGGVFWARLRLPEHPGMVPAGLGLTDSGALPFTLFLNGVAVRSNPADGSGELHRLPPFTEPLPAAPRVVVAIRFTYPANFVPVRFPVTEVELGPLAQVQLNERLAAITHFDDSHVAEIVGIGLFLGLAVFASMLFLLQRSRREYLWLGLFCFAYSLTAILKILVETGSLSESDPVMLIYRYAGCFSMMASLEFVSHFAQVRRWPFKRVLEVLFLLTPLIGLLNQFAFNLALVGCFALLFFYMCACFARAFRTGVAEIKLLLPFLALLVLVDTFYYSSYLAPGMPAVARFHLGSIGVGLEDLTVVTFLAGIMSVVLYRFHRVNREEQHAATEFRAARQLQQALIPEDTPPVPGFEIASAYQPAQEVGGDFFQVLPLPDRGGVLLAIGDVSGKGLEAAMTVAVIVGALRTLVEYTSSPATLLTSLNRRLLDRGAGFCTCIIVRLDHTGAGELASAGHLAPYLDGVELPLEPGLPLGLVPDTTYSEAPLFCPHGAQLTLLTDGVVEARQPRTLELFGFDRTRAISTGSAHAIAGQALAFGHGARQADDITVLTLTRA